MSWVPTQEQREMVRAMSGYGVAAADICRVIAKAVPEAEFTKACADDLEQGQIQASAKLQEQLYTQAVNGNTAALLHLSRQSAGGSIPSVCTTSEMCSWLGISKVALHDMRKRGVCEMVSRDRWNVKATVQAVTRHYRDIAAGRKSDSAEQDAPDLVTERALLARAQREGVEMSNEVERGNLIKRERHEDSVTTVAKICVRGLETLADRVERDMRVSPDVVEYIGHCVGELRDEIADAVAKA